MKRMIREALNTIMQQYPIAKEEPFAGHKLAEFIRHKLPEIFKTQFPRDSDLIWASSPGIGQWADAPWIAVFDPLITDTAQQGYYPVYLFNKTLDAISQ